jgi:hypothetical protein
MSEEEVSGLRVKEDRLMRDLHETCEWGKGERWGRWVWYLFLLLSSLFLCFDQGCGWDAEEGKEGWMDERKSKMEGDGESNGKQIVLSKDDTVYPLLSKVVMPMMGALVRVTDPSWLGSTINARNDHPEEK